MTSGVFRRALGADLNAGAVRRLETKQKNVALFRKVGEREGEELNKREGVEGGGGSGSLRLVSRQQEARWDLRQ